MNGFIFIILLCFIFSLIIKLHDNDENNNNKSLESR